MNSAYDSLLQESHSPIQFWQTPEFVVGEFVITVGVAVTVICVSHALGACR